MSIIERLDLFAMSLPRTCMYCAHSANLVLDPYSCLDAYVCMEHSIEGLRGKRVTAPPLQLPGDRGKRVHAPIVYADERCDRFEPIKFNSRKFRVLDLFGMFDDVSGER